MEFAESRCDVLELTFACYGTSHVVLYDLEFVDMICRKVKVECVCTADETT